MDMFWRRILKERICSLCLCVFRICVYLGAPINNYALLALKRQSTATLSYHFYRKSNHVQLSSPLEVTLLLLGISSLHLKSLDLHES
jgi:hypothetical protein